MRALPNPVLTEEEASLLRTVSRFKVQRFATCDKAAVAGLQSRGYVERSGLNGYGPVVTCTARGYLKAIAEGMIERHPTATMTAREFFGAEAAKRVGAQFEL